MEELRIGMVGSGMMGKAHTIALRNVPRFFYPPPAMPKFYLLADINEELAKSGAKSLGYERWAVGWKSVIEDPAVDVVYAVTPNSVHGELRNV